MARLQLWRWRVALGVMKAPRRVKSRRIDRRTVKTRSALLAAFRDLIQERDFDAVTVGDVIARAGVGRSTLYEHFAGKDELLAASIAGPFALLADAVRTEFDLTQLVQLLEHFWANRQLARAIFLGPVRRKTVAVLVELVEERLHKEGLARRGALIVSMRLAAVQLAEGLLAPVIAWLMAESRGTAATLALALRRVARASVSALSA